MLLDVKGEVILLNFGWVGFVVALSVTLVLDFKGLTNLFQMEVLLPTSDSFLTWPIIQIFAMGLLIFIAQMNANVVFRCAQNQCLQSQRKLPTLFSRKILWKKNELDSWTHLAMCSDSKLLQWGHC